MRIELDGTFLEVETSSGTLRASVDTNGYDASCIDVISRYVDAHETDTELVVDYGLAEGETSFSKAVAEATTRLDRLSLAQKLVACVSYRDGFRVPVIHPDNLYLNGGLLRVVHCGLQGMLAPMTFDQARFFASLQAMVLHIFRPKLAFEQVLHGGAALQDAFSVAVRQTTTVDELFAYIDAQLKAEQVDVATHKVSVPRRRYSGYRAIGIFGLTAAVVAGVFAWQTAASNRLQDAVVSAQAHFLANDYAGTMSELEGYAASSLPASAKYVLAVSSVNLDDLTATQKQAVLNTISQKSDEVTLNYWIAIGRGEFEQALDYAQNLGDDQLTLLAYTDLYRSTKLNSHMAGGKKQELLDMYAKAIDELTARLEGTNGTAAGE